MRILFSCNGFVAVWLDASTRACVSFVCVEDTVKAIAAQAGAAVGGRRTERRGCCAEQTLQALPVAAIETPEIIDTLWQLRRLVYR
ncbi:hypothetical protein [Thiohalocapsa marina]|uniref:hypothetical protein n=1 Tax=Thiohalocapsa marina TaxID=424902 RepID=UPI0036DF88FA